MPQMYPSQSWYTNRDACDLLSMLLMEVVFSLPQKSKKKHLFRCYSAEDFYADGVSKMDGFSEKRDRKSVV